MVAHWADLHSELPSHDPDLPVHAREKMIQPGGDGTPSMREFAVAELAFADETSTVPMPTRLTLNDTNFLASRETCSIEDQSGIAMYPSFQMSPGAGLLNTPVHSLLRMVTGPAYSQFRVNWRRSFTCNVANVAEGETFFSVFPDGRIVRNDVVLPSNSPTPVNGTGCACQGAGGPDFFVTSFYAFERARIAQFARINQGFGAFPGPVLPGELGGCFTLTSGGAVALYWDFVNSELPTPAPTRLRSATNLNAEPDHLVLSFIYDLHLGEIQQGLNVGVRTTMVLDPDEDDCIRLSNRTVAKADQPAIQITGAAAPSTVIANGFGVYSDPMPHDGPVTITVGPAGPVAAGFAVTMFLPGTAISTNRPAGDVVWQREGDGRFYIWFREGLSGAETITITPEC